MTTATLPSNPPFLKRNLFLSVTVSTVLVILIMAFSLGLHLYNIESIGDANAYYTAAVKSMLQSWSNFFFVAAEPGGSVTVDKPPLGLWIEAVFAYFLGVSGFSTSLPNILAGVFGIPLLYAMVKKYMGKLAGLVAAFIMAITPVFVATNRNNTMDGLLVFFLLLAAWAFIQATERKSLLWLLVGAFIVGLGFNVKMMQAFLPLPAFYALYFFGSQEGWLQKVFNLGIATALLIGVSLSWAVVVDLVPADSRPYIGSSDDNSVMGLIFGHNGISRLGNLRGGGGGQTPPKAGSNPQQGTRPGGAPQEALDACANLTEGTSCSFTQANGNTINGSCITPPNLNALACAPQGMNQPNGQNQLLGRQTAPQQAVDACAESTQGAACSFNLQNGNTINGSCIIPPNSTDLTCAPQGMIPQGQQGQGQPPNGQGGTPFSQETGTPGVFRFFTQPLSKQMSWLLPFALIGVLIALFASRVQLPVESGTHKALILWGGWLLTCVVFFSMVSGIFHSYYAIMLAPPLGAMVGIGFAQLWSWGADKKWAGAALAISAAVTIGFQYFASAQYNEFSWWMLVSTALLGLGIALMFIKQRLAYLTVLAAMCIIPFYWTVMTVASSANQNLPTAYSGGYQQVGPDGINRPRQPGGQGRGMDEDMLTFLEENTKDVEYLLAVPSAQNGSTLVLQTGRPVLFMGGFSGGDQVVTAEDLSAMVANGELRYVLYGGDRGGKQDISNWLQTSCSPVTQFSQVTGPAGRQGEGNMGMTLFECK
ncbi:MAG: glycosyltransferase family 39 protein [Chloroflexi bacterium]|nr:glycosyltransferase family 39 protein [Chloroflexota bacterium]